MREKLVNAMKDVFGDDQRRIDHALDVLKYADLIRQSHGGSELVITAAAILHDIGIHQAEIKYGSPAGNYQEIEGPPIAKKILGKLGVQAADTDHICRIVGSHHSAKDIDTIEFRTVFDADWIVNIAADHADTDSEKLKRMIEEVFKTETGRQIAVKKYLNRPGLNGKAEHWSGSGDTIL